MTTALACRWSPRWVSHLGALQGCLQHLGIEISDAWLYGGTGHAFAINVHEQVCPSGPTAWITSRLHVLGRNLGYQTEGVFARKDQADFARKQEEAWDLVRNAIGRGTPCYGWELEIPEYYVINGHDGIGYHYSGPGCEDGKGTRGWRELGDTDIGVLEVYSVSPGEAADDRVAIRQALAFALRMAESPTEWVFPRYTSGPAAYDLWVRALEERKASDMGTRYNAGVWAECRRNAVGFLQEAQARLQGGDAAPIVSDAFEEAILRYRTVADRLRAVAELYPWRWGASDEDLLPVDDASRAAVTALREARDAEAAGLAALARIAAVL